MPKNENAVSYDTAAQDDTLTVTDLAARWKMSDRKRIYEAIAEGRLKAFRVGKRVLRVKLSEVLRFEAAQGAA